MHQIATWFCAQCFARLGQRVGISLLELNTLGHALCAFLTYWIWWHKPLDIKRPVKITLDMEDEQALEFVASLCFLARIDKNAKESYLLDRFTRTILYFNTLYGGGTGQPSDLGHNRTRWTRKTINHVTWVKHRPNMMLGGLVDLRRPFFPVISWGSQGKKWIPGLGNVTVRPKLSSGRENSSLLWWSQGTEVKS